jgi:ADP-ribose pyrophosphatase YjhB (NUDIX family)
MDKSPDTSPPTPAIGVGGLVFNAQGQILLVARKNPPRAGEWHIPGGKLEPGESLTECCAREIFEETGIRAIPQNIVAIADRRIDGFHYVIIDFLAQLEDPEEGRFPTPASDAAEAGWFSPQEIKLLPIVEGLTEVISAGQRVLDRREKGLVLDSRISWLYA